MEEIISVLDAMGWPHFAFLFGLTFIIVFKTQIRSLLARITSVDKTGIKAQAVPEVQLEEKKRKRYKSYFLPLVNQFRLVKLKQEYTMIY